MASTKPEPKFRRLYERIARNELITPHLEAALLDQGDRSWPDEYPVPVQNKERFFDGYFHPSSHASAPPLYLYYEFHPAYTLSPAHLTAKEVLTFQIGSAMHAVIQNMLINMKLAVVEDCEYTFTDERNRCTGSIDIRKVTLPGGIEPLVEIKSAAWLPRKPYPQHEDQVQIYLDQQKAAVGSLLYFGKQSPHEFREFVIEYNPERVREIYNKWRKVREAVSFSDPSMLIDCCERDSTTHLGCPARNVCRIGKPTVKLGKR